MTNNLLKLNQEKTELILFEPRQQVQEKSPSLKLGDIEVKAADHIKNLGIILDRHLDMEKQINNTVRLCYWNIRRIGRMKYITDENIGTIVGNIKIRLWECSA